MHTYEKRHQEHNNVSCMGNTPKDTMELPKLPIHGVNYFF